MILMVSLHDPLDVNCSILCPMRSLDEITVIIDTNISNMSEWNAIGELMNHRSDIIIWVSPE
ncbi:hypothetical protein D3C76_1755490 [compost metagenome]